MSDEPENVKKKPVVIDVPHYTRIGGNGDGTFSIFFYERPEDTTDGDKAIAALRFPTWADLEIFIRLQNGMIEKITAEYDEQKSRHYSGH